MTDDAHDDMQAILLWALRPDLGTWQAARVVTEAAHLPQGARTAMLHRTVGGGRQVRPTHKIAGDDPRRLHVNARVDETLHEIGCDERRWASRLHEEGCTAQAVRWLSRVSSETD